MTDKSATNLEQTNHIERTLRPMQEADVAEQMLRLQTPQAQQQKEVHAGVCPICGTAVDEGADYCESCHNYINTGVCSFCGAHVDATSAFCPECGSPKAGIECPVCKTMNHFAFCKQCGTPLTQEAVAMAQKYRQGPLYDDIVSKARELARLERVLPYTSSQDMENDHATERLRQRVLELLARDRGEEPAVVTEQKSDRMTEEELEKRKAEIMDSLAGLLERMDVSPDVSPVKARNYVMACRPAGLRVAWLCNYKHAMHSSPCGCAKPQMGGRWIVLGKNSMEQIKDDK